MRLRGEKQVPIEARLLRVKSPAVYSDICGLQDRLAADRLADRIPDTVIFLEHTPVITLGMSAKPAHVLASPDSLARLGIELCKSPRGGDVTYHGPGQLVMYPIMKLTGKDADVRAYVARLEEVAIRTAGDFNVQAFRRSGKTGAWTEDGKIAAIGVRIRKWVACHGLSLNVNPDMAAYENIVPCGLKGEPVSSLAEILGDSCPTVAKVRTSMARHFEEVFDRFLRS